MQRKYFQVPIFVGNLPFFENIPFIILIGMIVAFEHLLTWLCSFDLGIYPNSCEIILASDKFLAI